MRLGLTLYFIHICQLESHILGYAKYPTVFCPLLIFRDMFVVQMHLGQILDFIYVLESHFGYVKQSKVLLISRQMFVL